jgi:hypothetical protein
LVGSFQFVRPIAACGSSSFLDPTQAGGYSLQPIFGFNKAGVRLYFSESARRIELVAREWLCFFRLRSAKILNPRKCLIALMSEKVP